MKINNTSIHENISKLVSDEFIPPEFNLTLETAILSIILVAITSGTIVGNAFVITAFLMEPKIRHPFNYFILNLALTALYIILGYWPLGTFMCGVWLFTDDLLATVTVFSIVAISLERFWSVTWPNHYRTRNTTRKAVVVIAVIWLFCLTLWIPPFVINRLSSDHSPYECFWEATENKPFAVIVAILCHYLPCVAMVAFYMKILHVMRNRLKVSSIILNMNGVPGPSDTDNKQNNSNLSTKQKQNVDDATNKEKDSEKLKTLLNDNVVPVLSDADSRQNNSNLLTKQKQIVDDATNKEKDAKKLKALLNDNVVPGPSDNNSKQTISNHSMKQKRNVDDSTHKKKDSKKLKTLLNGNTTTIETYRCNRVRKNQEQSVKRERTMFVALGYIVGSFLICWFPSYIVFDVSVTDPEIILDEVDIFICWMTYVNSLLNPILYAYTNRQFRTVFRNMCRCQVRCLY